MLLGIAPDLLSLALSFNTHGRRRAASKRYDQPRRLCPGSRPLPARRDAAPPTSSFMTGDDWQRQQSPTWRLRAGSASDEKAQKS